MENNENIIGRQKLFCRWWCRTREVPNTDCWIKIGNEEWKRVPITEFYIPWWSWPLEILHRMVFGKPKLIKSKSIEDNL